MRKLTPDQWEKKYIRGPVERFDQKYTMFNRPEWDESIRRLRENWSFAGEARDRPGAGDWEFALKRASSRATQLALFNTTKPNPSPAAMAMAKALAPPRPGAPAHPGAAAQRRPPREIRQADIPDPAVATRNIKKLARYFGADLVGVCRLDQRWVYSHTYQGDGGSFQDGRRAGDSNGHSRPQTVPDEFRYAVVMGFEMEYQMLRRFPGHVSEAATGMGYSRMAIANAQLTALVRGLGFKAIDCSTNDVALSVPLALMAGLGELGRNGILVTPQFGPRLRLSKVLTDMPLVPDDPIEFGVTEFCQRCTRCAAMCPSRSISSGERTAEPLSPSNAAGELKWPVHAETCRMHWSQANNSCSACIACCPYNKPDTAFHRTVLWLTDHARWADRLYVRADSLMGYGKPDRSGDFWERWSPRRNQRRPAW